MLNRSIFLRKSYPFSLPKDDACCFVPFLCGIQKRWKKPVDSAQTRLESRTRDLRLDKFINHLKKLRYPHIFEVYLHPVKRNECCKTTQKMIDLIEEEAAIIKESEFDAVRRLKKLLMMSASGTLNLHVLWLVRSELGLSDDFRDSVIPEYPENFRVEHPDTLALMSRDPSLAEASVEKWREKEYHEKWLSEHETQYAFPIQLPTGFRIEKGFRENLKNWQMLPYLKPYEKKDVLRVGNVLRSEKRVVGILHEFLSLMVEKMVEVERLSHFRRVFSMEVNVRELILKHPGIFYISTKGNQAVFLREAYSKGSLVKPNSIYEVRRKMLDLVLMGNGNTAQMQLLDQLEEPPD